MAIGATATTTMDANGQDGTWQIHARQRSGIQEALVASVSREGRRVLSCHNTLNRCDWGPPEQLACGRIERLQPMAQLLRVLAGALGGGAQALLQSPDRLFQARPHLCPHRFRQGLQQVVGRLPHGL
ncbi:MAG: hypothetical protein LBL59_03260, partial [Xanthomonadaceae bacterium]|nr:hypothetical protein [Xanthomonadaceae bacterium]